MPSYSHLNSLPSRIHIRPPMTEIKIHDKKFEPYILSDNIQSRIRELGGKMNQDLKGTNPVFLGVLNGCFRFASDLMAHFNEDCEINFLKVASYNGTQSTGKVNELIGLSLDIEGRDIIIIEDIVDTGHTLKFLLDTLRKNNPKSIRIATLLFKPEAYLKEYPLDYVGFEIPNLFVVGYGLDYDGYGRNLNDIYQIKS